jgi:hypothetical protein
MQHLRRRLEVQKEPLEMGEFPRRRTLTGLVGTEGILLKQNLRSLLMTERLLSLPEMPR